MLLKQASRVTFLVILLLVLVSQESECKRSRGRSRGSSGGSNVGRNKQKQPTTQQHYDPVSLSYAHAKKQDAKSQPKPQEAPKPSAPVDSKQPKPSAPVESKPPIQETAVKQQSSVQNAGNPSQTNERPIGWNVDQNGANKDGGINRNVGWNTGSSNTQGVGGGNTHQSPQYSQNPPPYSQHANPQSNAPYGSAHPQGPPPPYSQHPGSYGQTHGQPPPYSQYPNQPHYGGGYHQPPPGYPGGYGGHGGQYPGGYGGNYPGGYGGYGGGGFGHGYGGGFGGFGGSPFGYGMGYHKSSGGFFGKHAFRNILAGLLVWNLVRGFTSTPYHVYNYYHRPADLPENIPIPANTIVLCDENATSICAPNTAALCTSNNTILCVATVSSTAPCGANTTVPCVQSTIPCINETDPACANNTSGVNTTTVSLPCLANVTVQGKLDIPEDAKGNASYTATIQLFNASVTDQKGTVFCLTTLAQPEPELANATVMPDVPCYSADGKEVPSNGTEPCVNGVMPLITTPKPSNFTEIFGVVNQTSNVQIENATTIVQVPTTEAVVTSPAA